MASVTKDGKGWRVRWRDLRVVVSEDGEEQRSWGYRERTCPDKATADTLRREVERDAALGRNWSAPRETAVATVGRIALDYVAAAVNDPQVPEATGRFRSSMIAAFLRWSGEDRPVAELSVGLLRAYADSLPAKGRAAATRHRKVLEVELLWEWAEEEPDRYPGVPRPRRITGGSRTGSVRQPVPVVATADPTFEDVDRMIVHLDQKPWHRRLGVMLRFTGLRVSQVLQLQWSDVDLARGVLRVRAGAVGAKKGAGRALPMHASLVQELAGWGIREGLILPRPDGHPWRGDAPVEPFRRAWLRSGVDVAKWGVGESDEPGARAKTRVTHAVRAAVLTGLLGAGVPLDRANYLIGHARGATTDAYVAQGRPESSALWPLLVRDIASLPRIGETREEVIPILRAP